MKIPDFYDNIQMHICSVYLGLNVVFINGISVFTTVFINIIQYL